MRLSQDSDYLDFVLASGVTPDRNMTEVRDSTEKKPLETRETRTSKDFRP
jgi:hypothetical protein